MDVAPSPNYTVLDQPWILSRLFHPRPAPAWRRLPAGAIDVRIPVDADIVIGASFYMTDQMAPNILFFHGNGEIVADYDELGPLYNRLGINFLAVDYRGYGQSTGTPGVASMMADCQHILDFAAHWLKEGRYRGPLIVMGRSLGSASALELAARRRDDLDGLVIESGFAFAGPLLAVLEIDPRRIGFREEEGFSNLEKIATWDKPALVIHAEYDHIIPFSDGQALCDACPSARRELLKIPGANHNDIFQLGLSEYLAAIGRLAATAGG
jgi:fermentation-respiration switch protein FrsA (DUF1100 family)